VSRAAFLDPKSERGDAMAIDAEVRQVERTGAPGPTRFDWSGASIALLRRRWAEGARARAIAKELGSGVSRCAVLGKVHRLELQQPEFKRRHGRKERVRARRPRLAAKLKRAGRREVSRLTAAFIALGLDTVFCAPDVRTAHQFAGRPSVPPAGCLISRRRPAAGRSASRTRRISRFAAPRRSTAIPIASATA
jgi:hypothetical protein